MVERSVKSGVNGAQPVVDLAEKFAVGLPKTVITLDCVSVSVPAALVTVSVTVNVPELGYVTVGLFKTGFTAGLPLKVLPLPKSHETLENGPPVLVLFKVTTKVAQPSVVPTVNII